MQRLHTELADMFPPMTLEDLEGVNPAYSMQALRTVQRYNREQYNAHEELWDTIAEYVIKERSIRRYTEEVLQSLKNNL
jgi:predicted phage tail protein